MPQPCLILRVIGRLRESPAEFQRWDGSPVEGDMLRRGRADAMCGYGVSEAARSRNRANGRFLSAVRSQGACHVHVTAADGPNSFLDGEMNTERDAFSHAQIEWAGLRVGLEKMVLVDPSAQLLSGPFNATGHRVAHQTTV